MKIIDNITTINQWNERYDDVRGVVIHTTWGFYKGSIQWFKNPKAQASANFVISENGEISKCVPTEHTAWAQGIVTTTKEKAPKVIADNWSKNPNFFLLSCEVTDNRKKNWSYPPIQYQAAVELTAYLCKEYNIPISRDYVVMHKEIDPINRPNDPLENWHHDKFIQDVRLMAEKILSPQPEYVWNGWVTVRDDIHSLFVRSGPARMYGQAGCKILYPGNKVEVVEFVEGEKIAYTLDGKVVESCYWWKSKLGHYFSAIGTIEQPGLKKNDDVLNDLKKGVTKMIPEEKAAKLAEFEARKAQLEARKLELDEAYKVNEADFEAFDAEFNAFNSEPVVEVPAEPVEVVEPAVEAEPEVPAEPVVEEKPSLMDKFNALVEEFKLKVAELA